MNIGKKANYTLIISTLILFLTLTVIGVQVQRDKLIFEESKVKVTTSQEKLNRLSNYLSVEVDKLANSKTQNSLEFEIDRVLIGEQDINFSSSYEKEEIEELVKKLNLTIPNEIELRLETRDYIDRKVLFLVFNNLNFNQTLKELKNEGDCEYKNNSIVEDGTSKKFYFKELTDARELCKGQIRTCDRGILSGSYEHDSCFSGFEESVITSLHERGVIKYK